VFRSSVNGLDWKLPQPEKILNPASTAVVKKSFDQDRARVIEETLASFGAAAHVVEIHRGPTITQYGIEPDFILTRTGKMRVRVSKITALADDLALALAAPSIRIQAPVPGRKYIGIEVPNEEAELVSLLEGMQHKAFQQSKAFLKFVLGKDVSGRPVFVDLASLPHLLIAGTTGAGKSVCLHSVLRCLLLQRTPNELRLVLVDPKRVEMGTYNGLPHLLTPVVVEPEKVVGTLQWMSREMDSRYKKFAEAGARNIEDYNQRQAEKLPYIVVLIDELADLMMLAPEETERNLNRLAQLARATGIHVIIATQRPSVDVITGMIKANFPARIALNVASNVDSRVILDQPGAERLLGRGDMLYQAPDAAAPIRLQGVYVSDDEFNRIARFWRDQTQQIMQDDPDAAEKLPQKYYPSATISPTPLFDEAPEAGEDNLLTKAIGIVRQEERASISMLQRKLRIGYTRAARLIDRMEELDIVGKSEPGSGFRPVLDFSEDEDQA
jgi:S-DNA-T family DNA segregation ATPase FtsK/SpoIIIE